MPIMLVFQYDRPRRAAGQRRLFKNNSPLLRFMFALAGFQLLAASAQAQLATTDLYAGMHRIVAEVAQNPNDRAVGLMGRQSLPENQGMLFIFERAGVQCFWMKNTFVPLSIAFLRDDGTITNIADMQPLTTNSHCSSEPVKLALEVNQGWFAKRNITPNQKIRGVPTSR
jgi:uncharacterized membrane protein (UPF0127 family)